jgi:hypothetical protein
MKLTRIATGALLAAALIPAIALARTTSTSPIDGVYRVIRG